VAFSSPIRPLTGIQIIGLAALAVGGAVFAQTQARGISSLSQSTPVADHHQPLFSPDLAALMSTTPPVASAKARTADDLIDQLDAAGISRAVVLSTAYIFEQPSRKADSAEVRLRRERRRAPCCSSTLLISCMRARCSVAVSLNHAIPRVFRRKSPRCASHLAIAKTRPRGYATPNG
jgi:hypothetical protein